MGKRRTNIIRSISDVDCKKCGNKMEEREHDFETPRTIRNLIQQTYYYGKWYFCENCKYIQYSNKYKIFI